jgi:hypothetical protein
VDESVAAQGLRRHLRNAFARRDFAELIAEAMKTPNIAQTFIWFALALVSLSRLATAAVLQPEIVGTKTEDASTLILQVRSDASVKPGATLKDFTVNAQPVLAFGRHSAAIYEDKKTGNGELDYPQIVLHEYFLKLKEPLQEGRTYSVSSPFGKTEVKFSARSTLCEGLKFNQVGYSLQARKRYAFYAPWYGDLASPAPVAPAKYEVIQLEKRQVALTGTPELCDADDRVGGPAWRIDLSGLKEPGRYFISLPGIGCSEPFGLGDAAMQHSFFVHMKGLYPSDAVWRWKSRSRNGRARPATRSWRFRKLSRQTLSKSRAPVSLSTTAAVITMRETSTYAWSTRWSPGTS